jgi:hypothetical protein
VVSRVSYSKAASRNFSRHVISNKCHRNEKWNYWGQTQKPNQILLSELLSLFTSSGSICACVVEQLFLLQGTSLFDHRDFPLKSSSPETCPRDLRTETTAPLLKLLLLCLRNLPDHHPSNPLWEIWPLWRANSQWNWGRLLFIDHPIHTDQSENKKTHVGL